MEEFVKAAVARITSKFLASNPKGSIADLIASIYSTSISADINIASTFGSVSDLRKILSSGDIKCLEENFAKLLSNFYSQNIYNEYVFEHASHSLLKCIAALINLNEGEDVFVPYGDLSYAFLNPECNYDIASSSSHDKAGSIIAKEMLSINANTVKPLKKERPQKQYAKIIAVPSQIGELLSKDFRNEDPYCDLSERIIDMLENNLKEGGKMAIFLRDSVCKSKNWMILRKYLVTNFAKYSTSIIRIPIDNINKTASGCLFIIEKNLNSSGCDIIWLGDLCHKKFKRYDEEPRFFTLDVDAILTAFTSKDPQFFVNRQSWQLNSEYDLSPADIVTDNERMKTLVDSFIREHITADFFDNYQSGHKLIATLYSKQEDAADPAILDAIASHIIDLSASMTEDNINFLAEHLTDVIKLCFDKGVLSENSDILSKGCLELIRELCWKEQEENKSVLLPFGDLILSSITDDRHVTCVDADNVSRAFNHIINEALHLDIQILSQEMFEQKDASAESGYDYIFSCLPHNILSKETSIIDDIIRLFEQLNIGGRMAIVLPREACYTEKWIRLREFIANNVKEYFSAIISLNIPSSETIHDAALFIIERRKESTDNEWILMVDACKEEFILSDTVAGPYGLKVDSIAESIREFDRKSVCDIPVERLDKGYNLLPTRYFRLATVENIKSKLQNVTPLKELIKICPNVEQSSNAAQYAEGKVVRRHTLSDNYLACRIMPENMMDAMEGDYRSTANGGYVALSHGKIFVGKIENEPEDLLISIDETIVHFEVISDRTSLDYILKVLATHQYVKEQAVALSKGYIWTDNYLHADDLLDICINLPSIEVQNEKLLADSKRGYEDKSAEVQKNFDEFRKNMHMQKHKIGQTISALSNWVNLMNYAREINNGVVDDTAIIIPAYNTSAKDIFEKITRTAEKLTREITALDSSYGIDNDIEDIAVADFLDEYIEKNVWSGFDIIWNSKAHRHSKDIPLIDFDESDEYRVKSRVVPGEYIVRAGDPLEYIRCTNKGLETILDNIIANAQAHGFKKQDKVYKVKFDVVDDHDNIILYVSNNGEPLHKSMESDDIYTYGHTSGDDNHSGIGCYQIKDYMDSFKGSIEIISTPDEEFTVTYKVTFVNANPAVEFLY